MNSRKLQIRNSRARTMAILESGRKNIVVLGAGFGGITALLKLRRLMADQRLFPRYNLVLVNKSEQHLYTPALYEIASIPKGEASATCLKSSICIQVEDIIGRFRHIRFIGEEAIRLDPRTHIITFKSGNELNYEYLIVALGAETNFFGITGAAGQAFPLKTFEDAVRLRNRAEELAGSGRGVFRVIVGGGGPTGVETAAETINFLRRLEKTPGSGKNPRRAEVTLIESSPEILPGFPSSIIRKARKRLKNLGVKIIAGTPIEKVSGEEISLAGGKTLPCDLFIWSGGVKPPDILKNFSLPLDKKGWIMTNEFLEARPHVYAVGDAASFPRTGKPLPKNVPVAEGQARLAAKNIVAEITGGPRQKYRPMNSYPYILAVGGKYALTDLVIVKFSGFLGWALKQIVELRYLLSILPWRKAARMWLGTVYYSTRND